MVSFSSDQYTTCSICLDEFTQHSGTPNDLSPEVDQSSLAERSRDLIRTLSHQISLVTDMNQSAGVTPNVSQSGLSESQQINGTQSYDRQVSNQSMLSNGSGDPTHKRILGLLRCEHIFHFQCIWTWLVLRGHCPVCKKIIMIWDIQAVSGRAFVAFVNEQRRKKNEQIQMSEFDGAVDLSGDTEFRQRCDTAVSQVSRISSPFRSRTNTFESPVYPGQEDIRAISPGFSDIDFVDFTRRMFNVGHNMANNMYVSRHVTQVNVQHGPDFYVQRF